MQHKMMGRFMQKDMHEEAKNVNFGQHGLYQ
jgi:hypothetical protein